MSLPGTMQHEHDLPQPDVNFLIGSPPSSLQREGPGTHDAFKTPSDAIPVSISHVLGHSPGGNTGDGVGVGEAPPPYPRNARFLRPGCTA